MDALMGISLLLMILSLIVAIVAVITLIIMAVAKKKIMIPGVIFGMSLGIFVLASLVLIVTSLANNNKEDTYILNDEGKREFEGVEVDSMGDAEIDQTIKKAREAEGIDKTKYKEADLAMDLHKDYAMDSSLKVTSTEVIIILPSSEDYGNGVGNIIYAEVDDLPVVL